MNWTKLLNSEIESAYKATEVLFDFVEDDVLDWKPETGSNWMTTGQLLYHTANACGACFRGFITGDWGMPEGVDVNELSPEEMLPPAEKMPTVASIAEARKILAEDQRTSYAMVKEAGADELASKTITAPWDPREVILGQRLLHMIHHLNQHKAQLFYYLKLQGKPVNTGHLWAM
jgi:uncharacterized damage-inducible protein DinB